MFVLKTLKKIHLSGFSDQKKFMEISLTMKILKTLSKGFQMIYDQGVEKTLDEYLMNYLAEGKFFSI